MKKFFILVVTGVLLFSGCLAHIYDVNFPDNSEVATIPYAEGLYYFEVTAGQKKGPPLRIDCGVLNTEY